MQGLLLFVQLLAGKGAGKSAGNGAGKLAAGNGAGKSVKPFPASLKGALSEPQIRPKGSQTGPGFNNLLASGFGPRFGNCFGNCFGKYFL